MLLLAQDELFDVLLCLTRFNILMVAFACRKLRAAVDALPPNSCLLQLFNINLTKKWDYHWHAPSGVRIIFPWSFLETARPYKLRIYPSSDDLKPVTRRSRSSTKLILAFLNAIRNANVYSVHIDLPQLPRKFEQMVWKSAITTGRIHVIVVNTDWLRGQASAFEALPLVAGKVMSLKLNTYPINWRSQLTPTHQGDKLIRNSIDRGVYSLKLMDKERHCRSSVSRHGSFRPDEEQVELWLNWISLSPGFLSRFIQASEACESNHKVKLLLRGANVCQQDLSQFRIRDPPDGDSLSHYTGPTRGSTRSASCATCIWGSSSRIAARSRRTSGLMTTKDSSLAIAMLGYSSGRVFWHS